MDSLTSTFNGGIIRRYFRRRKYLRLYGGKGRQRRSEVTRFEGGPDYDNRCSNPTRRRRRFGKIKTVPRVIVRTFWSPSAKLLARLRNAYLDIFGGKRNPRARKAGTEQVYSFNQVENRIVLEICKALKAHRS